MREYLQGKQTISVMVEAIVEAEGALTPLNLKEEQIDMVARRGNRRQIFEARFLSEIMYHHNSQTKLEVSTSRSELSGGNN